MEKKCIVRCDKPSVKLTTCENVPYSFKIIMHKQLLFVHVSVVLVTMRIDKTGHRNVRFKSFISIYQTGFNFSTEPEEYLLKKILIIHV